MILSPIEPARLPAVLDLFAASLAAHSSRVFQRIAVPGAGLRAAGPVAVRHRAVALDLAARIGMGILPGAPALDFSWNGAALRTDTEAYVLLHEVAHFQIAPAARRQMIDFGLGPGPETGARAAAERAAVLPSSEREADEALASLLGVLWEAELGQPGLASFLDQNWLEGAGRPGAAAHFENVLARLVELGLADTAGRPKLNLAAH